MPRLSDAEKHQLLAVNHALNDYSSAAKDAEGFTSGKRITRRREAKRQVLTLLWTYREMVQQLIREANP